MLSNDFEDGIDLNDLPSFDDLPPLHRPDATIIVEHELPDPVPEELPLNTETVTHYVLEGGSTRGNDVLVSSDGFVFTQGKIDKGRNYWQRSYGGGKKKRCGRL